MFPGSMRPEPLNELADRWGRHSTPTILNATSVMLRLQGLYLNTSTVLLAALCSGALGSTKAPAAPASEISYTFKQVELPLGAYPDSVSFALNDEGDIAGYYFDENWFAHSFIWHRGLVTSIDAPGFLDTAATSINSRGQVVGFIDDYSWGGGAVYDRETKVWTPLPDLLPDPNAVYGEWVVSINNHGTILGLAVGDMFPAREGWTFDGDSYDFFGLTGVDGQPTGVNPKGINDSVAITGYYYDPNIAVPGIGAWHGFLKKGKKITTFDIPGAFTTVPTAGINNEGDIAGTYTTGTQPPYSITGFVRHEGRFTSINYPGTTGNTFLNSINNKGQLLGQSWDEAGNQLIFIATPVGEHATPRH